jgi:hypothetical protein
VELPRAAQTIKICHLHRRRLRDARVVKIQQMRKMMTVDQLIDPADMDAKQAMNELIEMVTAANAEYAGAARAVRRDPAAFPSG